MFEVRMKEFGKAEAFAKEGDDSKALFWEKEAGKAADEAGKPRPKLLYLKL